MTLQERIAIVDGLIKEDSNSTIADYQTFMKELAEIQLAAAQYDIAAEKAKAMRMRPILYSTPMVIAVLQNVKRVTRRVLAIQPDGKVQSAGSAKRGEPIEYSYLDKEGFGVLVRCPYGDAGDGLWGRETTCPNIEQGGFYYRTDSRPADYDDRKIHWTPSIFMPRQACRIFQKVESSRPERLLDITAEDAILEGIQTNSGIIGPRAFRDYSRPAGWVNSPIDSYMTLWDKINGKNAHLKNPMVWRIATDIIPKPANF